MQTSKANRKKPRWRRQTTYWIWRLGRRVEAREKLARGIAVGMFAGFLPMIGQSFVAIALAMLVGGSKVVAAAMTFVSNPATTLPMFAFNYWVGCRILGVEMHAISLETFQSWEAFSKLGLDFVATIFFGSCIVGGIAGGIAYVIGHALISREQKRKQESRARARAGRSAQGSLRAS